ncbi:hypothetical protein Cs7R123_19460 [Catellatospora sp. TT07R-123]|uniref:nuclear transport factor 2 family protein n=1 Tax=Catellatospora sp. TT07R-123 TaxID=2733863 RepID=UPI001B188820|nr:nuclear transport factor 2 family protein [Catellatospora sp. TT07R-123]GHJ44604.1 hypothetical protein Cs7R123_19460 [Catellatospora sp. TT07R-123]
MTPRELFDQRVRLIHANRWHDLAQQYAPDAVVEIPFAPPQPIRLVGREAIAAQLARAGTLRLAFAVRDVVVHETADPEVIIVEYGYDLTDPATGHTAAVDNIQLFRVRDGLITYTRDFHDHRAIGELLNRP